MARKAAAAVAANVARASDRNRCERVLKELFDDDAEQVREAANQCFQVFEKDELREFPGLVAAFITPSMGRVSGPWNCRRRRQRNGLGRGVPPDATVT